MDAIDTALDNCTRGLFGMGLGDVKGLLDAKDYAALDTAIGRTLAAEADRVVARVRMADLNEARTRAAAATVAPTPYKHITIAGAVRVRIGRKTETRNCPMYVTGLSWGADSRITKVSFDADVTKAHRFSAVTAADVAGKLARSYRSVSVVAA